MTLSTSFRFLSLVFTLLLISTVSRAADVKVILTGNTADLKNPDDLFATVEQYMTTQQEQVLWVLNGDLFPKDFTDDQLIDWKAKAFALLDRYPQLQFLINQGDRDWKNSGKKGWKKLQATDKLLSHGKHPRFHDYLENGCPGPWTFSLPSLEIIVINSQWWNHPYEKPIPSSNECDIVDTDVFIEELEGILDETQSKNVMVLSHFPLESLGNYGGRFPVTASLFPPLVGNAIVAFHQNIGSSKDIVNDQFNAFRHKLHNVLQDYSSIIFASGHERNQTILKSANNFYINSGALAKSDYVTSHKRASMASDEEGFMEITYADNGAVLYQHYQTKGNAAMGKGQSGTLMASACEGKENTSSVITNTLYRPCVDQILPSQKMQSSNKGITTAVGGAEYASSKFKEFWLGKHYRYSWTVPVQVPYLDMDTTFKGLVINGKGGGRQTTSLKLSAGNGKEYVFRSVDKDPFRALSYELRSTVVSSVLKDQTTTQQPYGAMAVSHLMDKVGLLHATPELYVLPKDDKLGAFKESYGNLFGMLEERPTDKLDKEKVFGGAKNIEKSFKMFDKLYRDHDNRIAINEFARARMFDLWIGDWSKHEDNWKWAGYKDESGELFRPIPRDRDHAFSRGDGVIPWLADREWGMPNGENFDEHIVGLRSLMWQARHLDRYAANQLTKEDWIKAAHEIQSSVKEEDIDSAVRQMPKEIYERDGKAIERKLKARIKDLPMYAEQYYLLLAKEVDVVGSYKEEYFLVNRNKDGSAQVTIYDLDKNNQPNLTKKYYQRTFFPNETKEIRLFGLLEDDVFNIEGEADESILVRIVGGGGTDVVTDHSKVTGTKKKTLIYDASVKTDGGTEAKQIEPKNAQLYEYNRKAFFYNTYLPIALIAYNQFTGLSVSGGVSFTRHNFSKPDFSAKHSFKLSASAKGNYEFDYSNQFRQVVGRWDATSEVIVSRPLNYNYFFGVGNDTEQDRSKPKNYYRTQYNSVSVAAGLQRQFWKRSLALFGISYEEAEGIKRANSYLSEHPDVFGIEKLDMLFVKGMINLDFRDRAALPERGFRLQLTQQAGHVSQSKDELVSISEFEMEQYVSTYTRNPLTLGVRLGGGITEGQLPFYKLFSLGQLNDLNGFKRNRFTGQSKAFLNTELRWQLTQVRNSFLPLKVGVRGFYDLGRVWVDNDPDPSDYWHQGYGGGFYITPLKEQFAFNITAGSSKEESLLLMISVGSFFK